MINVFRNHAHLCAITTSVFLFLQGVDVSVGKNNEGVLVGKENRVSMEFPCVSATIAKRSKQGQQLSSAPYVCQNDVANMHEISGYTIKITDPKRSALYVGVAEEDSLFVQGLKEIDEVVVGPQAVSRTGNLPSDALLGRRATGRDIAVKEQKIAQLARQYSSHRGVEGGVNSYGNHVGGEIGHIDGAYGLQRSEDGKTVIMAYKLTLVGPADSDTSFKTMDGEGIYEKYLKITDDERKDNKGPDLLSGVYAGEDGEIWLMSQPQGTTGKGRGGNGGRARTVAQSEKGKFELQASSIKGFPIGLEAESGGKIIMNGGNIESFYIGALASHIEVDGAANPADFWNVSSIVLTNANIKVSGPRAFAGLDSNGGRIRMDSGSITFSSEKGVAAEGGGIVTLTNVTVNRDNPSDAQSGDNTKDDSSAFFLEGGSYIKFDKGELTTRGKGILFGEPLDEDRELDSNFVEIEGSNIQVQGEGSYGIYGRYVENASSESNSLVVAKTIAEKVQIVKDAIHTLDSTGPLERMKGFHEKAIVFLDNNTKFKVPDGTAFYGDNLYGAVSLEGKAELSGDLLLVSKNNSNLSISANDSKIIGGAYTDKKSRTAIELFNKSEWQLTNSKHTHDNRVANQNSYTSSISYISLINSAIRFSESSSESNKYSFQKLQVGNGSGLAYNAGSDARIYFNVRPDSVEAKGTQISDQLIVNGDVSGKTIVHVQAVSGGAGSRGDNGQPYDISTSLIQVYGNANSDSFVLDSVNGNGGYVTLGNLPYRYSLRVHGPFEVNGETLTKSENGSYDYNYDKELIKSGQKFWDFRLESEYIRVASVHADPASDVRVRQRVHLVKHVANSEGNGIAEDIYVLDNPYSRSDADEALAVPAVRTLLSVKGSDTAKVRAVPALYTTPSLKSGNTGLYKAPALDPSLDPSLGPDMGPDFALMAARSGLDTDGDTYYYTDDEYGEYGEYDEYDGVEDPSYTTTGRILQNTNSFPYGVTERGDRRVVPTSFTVLARTDSDTTEGVNSGFVSTSSTILPPTATTTTTTTTTVEPIKHQTSSSADSSKGVVTTDTKAKAPKPNMNSEITAPNNARPVGRVLLVSGSTPTSTLPHVVSNDITDSKVPTPVKQVLSAASTNRILPAAASKALVVESVAHSGQSNQESSFTCSVSNGVASSKNGAAKGESSKFYWCNSGTSNEIKDQTLTMSDKNTHVIYAKGQQAASSEKNNGKQEKKTTIDAENVTITGIGFKDSSASLANIKQEDLVSAVLAEQDAKIMVKGDKTSISAFPIGLEARTGGLIEMDKGEIAALYVGALADSKSSAVKLNGTKINVKGSLAVAGLSANNGGVVEMDSGSVSFTNGVGVRSELGGHVKLKKVNIVKSKEENAATGRSKRADKHVDTITNLKNIADGAAFLLSDGGIVDFAQGTVSTNSHGLWFKNINGNSSAHNIANIESSSITISANEHRSYGIYFDGVGKKPSELTNKVTAAQANSGKSPVKVPAKSSVEERNVIENNSIEENVVSEQNNGKVSNVITTTLDTKKTLIANGSTENNEIVLEQKAPIVKRSVPLLQNKSINLKDQPTNVLLKATEFAVFDGVAVYANNSEGTVSLEEKAILKGGMLLIAKNNSNVSISAQDSILRGGAYTDSNSNAHIALHGSQWLVSPIKYTNYPEVVRSDCLDTCISSLNMYERNGGTLDYSIITFLLSESQSNRFRTLRIGKGSGTVYSVHGKGEIDLSADLNPEFDSKGKQITDRLLIHGDVSGTTTVNVRANRYHDKKDWKDHVPQSVSIIQVHGKAEKDSFKLAGEYVTTHNSPYQYTLRSYGPNAVSDTVYFDEELGKKGGEFWDFRLENQYVTPTVSVQTSVSSGGKPSVVTSNVGSEIKPVSPSEHFVRSVVPQVPTYLLLPNTVFHAGLMDISNQNKQLEALRGASSNGMLEIHENPALFLHSYGGNYGYVSDLSALEYGYGGNLDYHAVEAGILLKTIESAYSNVAFGVMGSYGRVSLQPIDVAKSQKSAFDKWSVTAYSSMQHDGGFYVDGLFSYGALKGDVLTLARGKTATLEGNPLSVSFTGGQTFATGYEGFVVDPQVQVVYQRLQFKEERDVDNFDIKMGNLDQWMVRLGGRLVKNPIGFDNVRTVSFYGKVHLSHNFGKKQSVNFKEDFQLGALGSSLEAGLGFNAQLLPKLTLHGDVMYQHKLTKAGFSGASFSGGLRYQF
ncbi:autotransporter outer membrane beta-barrel domain-containing protein [Bartonella sp. B30(2025)]